MAAQQHPIFMDRSSLKKRIDVLFGVKKRSLPEKILSNFIIDMFMCVKNDIIRILCMSLKKKNR